LSRRFLLIVSGVLLVALAALLLVGWRMGRIHGIWYRWTSDEQAFFQALSRGTMRGQTREAFESLLGPGKTLNATEDAAQVKIMKKWEAEKHPDAPDGYRPGDVFVQFKVGAGQYYSFQFRDGRLVNHDPTPFATALPFTVLGR